MKMGLGGPGYRRSRKLANMSRKLELSESGLEWRNIDFSQGSGLIEKQPILPGTWKGKKG